MIVQQQAEGHNEIRNLDSIFHQLAVGNVNRIQFIAECSLQFSYLLITCVFFDVCGFLGVDLFKQLQCQQKEILELDG